MAALAGAGGGGGHALDFTHAACKGLPGIAMELKVCEWGCGVTFVRRVPLNARMGRKVCNDCLRKQFEERAAQHAGAGRQR